MKTKDAAAIAAAVSAATSEPGYELFTWMVGRFSVVVSGLSQHLWSISGSPTCEEFQVQSPIESDYVMLYNQNQILSCNKMIYTR